MLAVLAPEFVIKCLKVVQVSLFFKKVYKLHFSIPGIKEQKVQ